MSNMYLEVIERECIKDYQMDVLSDKNIRLFLPLTFMESDEETILAYVDGEGYVRLNQVGRIDRIKAIDMIGMLADGMKDAANSYIFPEEYEVSEETVFVNRDLSAIRLLFRPSEDNRRMNRREIISGDMRELGLKETGLELMNYYQGEEINYFSGQAKGAPPDPPRHIYRRVRSLADLLSVRVGEDAAGPIWEAARLFRADGYGPGAALQELAKLRHRVWIKETVDKQDDADNCWE